MKESCSCLLFSDASACPSLPLPPLPPKLADFLSSSPYPIPKSSRAFQDLFDGEGNANVEMKAFDLNKLEISGPLESCRLNSERGKVSVYMSLTSLGQQSFFSLQAAGLFAFASVCSHSVVSDSATPWTVVCQALLSMGFSRQEYWSRLPFPLLEALPCPGI